MMPDWPTLDASLNAIVRDTFGEPVLYQAIAAGQPVGDPVTITVVRENRVREEAGTRASFEEISVNPSDLAVPPAKGDIITAWRGQYTLVTMRQPDPYVIILTLQQR